MADTERPNRQSNMEKAEGDRRPPEGQPEQERTAGRGSTVSNSGLSDARDDDPVMPSDDATLDTKI